jgi:phosphomannomutase
MVKGFNFRSTSDGWRGVTAAEITFDNLSLLACAISLFIDKNSMSKKIVLGYDTRFMSKQFAEHIANIFLDRGIACFMFADYATTPMVSFATNYLQASFGLNVTASHNPPVYNGVKIRMSYGGTASQDIIAEIEANLGNDTIKKPHQASLENIDLTKEYTLRMKEIIDFTLIEKNNDTILVDSMHGTSRHLLASVLEGTNIQVDYIHTTTDPYFGGVNPEPKYESTAELQSLVKEKHYDLGFAHDGDGDRIVGCVPEIGYISPHDIAAILVLYLTKYKKMSGIVIGSSTLGRKTRIICETLGLHYKTMAVGFKNALPLMLKGEVLVAAEENGGIGFGMYLPERDATFAALLLLEANASVGIAKLYKEIEAITGTSSFNRHNYKPSTNRKILFDNIVGAKSMLEDIGTIKSIDTTDGMKITFENNDWCSIRISGTEEILRIYCEASDRAGASRLKDAILKIIESKDV